MRNSFGLLIVICAGWHASAQHFDEQFADNQILEFLDSRSVHYSRMAREIWSLAELGYQEVESSNILQEELIGEGFTVTAGVAGMPTSFIAHFGSGYPVIVLLAEFDALPGLSQDTLPFRKELSGSGSGHGCGHHLFGVGSVAAGVAIKHWMQNSNQEGTIRVYGTPAEEGGGGKVYMVKEGLFDDVDVVLHWHPGNANSANATSSLANKSAKFRFYGHPAHAARSPHLGRSALDGVEAMNYMANLMREHIPSDSRIHYVITKGGDAPNVIPGFAEVFYYCRHPDPQTLSKNFEWLVQIAEAAAIGTQTEMDYEIIHGIYNLLPNETIARALHKNLSKVGGVFYDERETAFAQQIVRSLNEPPKHFGSASEIRPFQVFEKGMGGSTDVGDVSWVVPTAGVRTATFVPGIPNHSWQAVACGGTSIGMKGMMVAAKTLALSGAELFNSRQNIAAAWEELRRRRGTDFRYQSLVGDRTPPLDYRH